ncbi:MAG TPA: MaoC/PaaZ C-terminal domain-containing protein, partial [Anaerolineaceae bacterium]|nr:MaoC/PaaZ C-terminal domain-containing protein [Anaerolineaceae bacterium]
LGDMAVTAGRTVSEADIVNFAGLSGDFSQIHTDAEYARQGGFGQRVAHGMLEVSIVSGLLAQLCLLTGTVLALRELTWKFSLPVYIGDTIQARINVSRLKAVPRLKGGLVTFQIEVTNQEGGQIGSGTWTVLVASKAELTL